MNTHIIKPDNLSDKEKSLVSIRVHDRKTISVNSNETELENLKNYKPSFWEEWVLWPITETINNITQIPRAAKYFVQRGIRGYSDQDVWNLNSYIAKILSQALNDLASNHSGCPPELFDNKTEDPCYKWKKILEEMVQGFEAVRKMDSIVPVPNSDEEKEYKKLEKELNKSIKLFNKWFFNLWD